MERKTSRNVCVINTCLCTSVFCMCSLEAYMLLTAMAFSLGSYITTLINYRYLVGFFSSVNYHLVPEWGNNKFRSLIFFLYERGVLAKNRANRTLLPFCYLWVCWNQWNSVCSVLSRWKALNVLFEIHKINQFLNSGPSCINMKKPLYFAYPAITQAFLKANSVIVSCFQILVEPWI